MFCFDMLIDFLSSLMELFRAETRGLIDTLANWTQQAASLAIQYLIIAKR